MNIIHAQWLSIKPGCPVSFKLNLPIVSPALYILSILASCFADNILIYLSKSLFKKLRGTSQSLLTISLSLCVSLSIIGVASKAKMTTPVWTLNLSAKWRPSATWWIPTSRLSTRRNVTLCRKPSCTSSSAMYVFLAFVGAQRGHCYFLLYY